MKCKHEFAGQAARLTATMALAILFVCFLGAQAFAQATQTIRGVVTSVEDQEPVPGVNIHLKGVTSVGTVSGAKGEFVFPQVLRSGDVLVFSFMGLKTTEYVVPESRVESVAIAMPVDPIQMVEEILVEGDDQTSADVCVKRSSRRKTER